MWPKDGEGGVDKLFAEEILGAQEEEPEGEVQARLLGRGCRMRTGDSSKEGGTWDKSETVATEK